MKLTKKELSELFKEADIVYFDGHDFEVYGEADDEEAYLYDSRWEKDVTVYYDSFLKNLPDDLAFYKIQKLYPKQENKND